MDQEFTPDSLQTGEQLLRPDEMHPGLILVLKGDVRLIAFGDEQEGPFSLDKRGPGQLLGWASLLRGVPSEFVQASTEVIALFLPGNDFIRFMHEIEDFACYFRRLTNTQEAYLVAVAAAELQPQRPKDWRYDLVERTKQAKTHSLTSDDSIKTLPQIPNDWSWHLSTPMYLESKLELN